MACRNLSNSFVRFGNAFVNSKVPLCVREYRTGLRFYTTDASSVDAQEIHRFGELSKYWAYEGEDFKALHAFNRVRVPWIVDTICSMRNIKDRHLSGMRVADVACGGGILTLPLARLGASLLAVDASPETVEAVRHAVRLGFHSNVNIHAIQIKCCTVEELADVHQGEFDAVVASEVLEHVADLESFVSACVRIARSGAPLFFTTINKTAASKILAIWMAQDILKIVPADVHRWDKFVEPLTLRSILEMNGCDVRFTHGITYNVLTNEWSWIRNTAVNYAMMAVKK